MKLVDIKRNLATDSSPFSEALFKTANYVLIERGGMWRYRLLYWNEISRRVIDEER